PSSGPRGTLRSAPGSHLPADTSGLFIVIAGHLSAGEARQLATARRASGPAMVLLLAVSTWAAERPGAAVTGETDEASSILTAAGWRVATVTADTPLSVAWDMLNRSHMARGGPSATGPAGRAGPATGPDLDGGAQGGNGAPAASTATPPAEAV